MKLVGVCLVLVACGGPQVSPPPDLMLVPDAATSKAESSDDCGASTTTIAAYAPAPSWSGRPSQIPDPPTLATSPIRVGGNYTVYGATHDLTSPIHASDFAHKVTIEGYIVSSNISTSPKCAFHHTGHADPPHCVTDIPAFVIADSKGDTSGRTIRVMGWASNFANVFEANEHYKKSPATYQDELWGTDVPNPLPAVGAKVRVTGSYGVNFTKSSSGMSSDPTNGIMTVDTIVVVEPAPQPAKLP
jgi:hypothetical protein